MLRAEDAIRTDFVDYRPTGGDKVTIYIFVCSTCDREIRVQKSGLKTKTGLCVRCVKHKLVRPYQRPYHNLQVRATKYNLNLTITYNQFISFTKIKFCKYCNKEILWKPYGGVGYYLDRKNNALGYTMENVVVCCPKCNFLKSNFFEYEEFIEIMKFHNQWISRTEVAP